MSRSGYRIAVFSLFFDDVEHDLGDLGFVASGLVRDLGEAGRVDVEGLYVD